MCVCLFLNNYKQTHCNLNLILENLKSVVIRNMKIFVQAIGKGGNDKEEMAKTSHY